MNTRSSYLYLLPIWIYLATMVVSPLLIVFLGSLGLSPYTGYKFTLEGYAQFFAGKYVEALVFTFWNSSLATIVAVLSGYFFALYLVINKPNWWNKLSFIPLIAIYTPYLIAAFMWWTLLWPRGYISLTLNGLLLNLGLIQTPLYLVNDPYGIGIILGKVWYTFTLTFLLTYGPLQLINPEIIEAARMLGANTRVIIRRIYLPLSRYALLASSSLVFLDNFTGVSVPLVLGAAWPQYLSVLILNDVTLFFNYIMAYTSGVIYIIIAVLSGYMFFRYTKKAIIYQVR